MAKFQRKNLDPHGKYHLAYKVGRDENGCEAITEQIVIEGRQVFETDDKHLIKTLKNDPEIEEVEGKTVIEGKGE